MSEELINCKIVLDILEGLKRQGWFFNGRRPKSGSKSSNNNRKSTNNKPHKQQQMKMEAGEEKKTRNFGPPTLREPTFRGSHFSELPPFGATRLRGLSAGPPSADRPKFRPFFSLSRSHFRSFSLSGGLLVEFWWCLKRWCQLCTFGSGAVV